MLISSELVTAINKSESGAPASRNIFGEEAKPCITRKSCLSRKCSKRNDSSSTKVISLSSLTKLAAKVEPTCPAPKIIIFI